ncbi:MAG: helix-turn-helix domain-containing protein [Methanolobus sp.]|uniref:winged helix-turn-helix transcriptional regulator n=1 Tax=Methanolobus sp. TaxID=1874737 RepID=UPI00272F20CD|nr:helix-turn-helix domain-containing protein [Methanolobus sp.]MDP2216121.1 helix-turn-helix domain-containing protein [Methanolobus sp.]
MIGSNKKDSKSNMVAENKSRGSREYNCPVEATLDVIGGKWKPLILWQLKVKTLRYNNLQQLLPGISPKMLTRQLREMEEDGLVGRKMYPEIPPRVEYSLTEFGMTVIPVLEELCRWGGEYMQQRCCNGKEPADADCK